MDRLSLTPVELDYLRSQRLGRLATVDGGGAPQNNPVGFFIDEATSQVLIGGFNLAQSRKFATWAPTRTWPSSSTTSRRWTHGPRAGSRCAGGPKASPTPTRRCRASAAS
jgi:Pyridoxamine 5'-phosphate oxidase